MTYLFQVIIDEAELLRLEGENKRLRQVGKFHNLGYL